MKPLYSPTTQDDPRLFGYNVEERVNSFVKAAMDQAAHYATNHIMFTMGSDFNYEDATEWFKNLDKIIYHVNKMVRLLLSSPPLSPFPPFFLSLPSCSLIMCAG